VNVEYNKLKIINSILKNEPDGRHTLDIAKDTKLNRDTVTRLCKQLQNDDYIFKKNKQSEYHVERKVYEYPELTAFSLGTSAERALFDIHRGWEGDLNEFCSNEICKKILYNADNTNTDFHDEIYVEEKTLLKFAIGLGAFIVYIMIQALGPKKALPTMSEILYQKHPIKGQDKDDMIRAWVENAIKPTSILSKFCNLPMVKRGQAIFADKGKTLRIDPSLDPKKRKKLKEVREKMRKMDIDDPTWSRYEMDEENFTKLTETFAKIFPGIFRTLENIRKTLPGDIQSFIEMAKEEEKRIKQLEKDDPQHIKCNGELVADFRYEDGNHKVCSKCGRRLLAR
jgi:hypothetical protein